MHTAVLDERATLVAPPRAGRGPVKAEAKSPATRASVQAANVFIFRLLRVICASCMQDGEQPLEILTEEGVCDAGVSVEIPPLMIDGAALLARFKIVVVNSSQSNHCPVTAASSCTIKQLSAATWLVRGTSVATNP